MPLDQLNLFRYGLDRVPKISTGFICISALHRGHARQIESVSGGAVIMLYFDFRKPLIVNGVSHHDAVAQTFPVSVALLRPGRKRQFQPFMFPNAPAVSLPASR